MVLNILNHINVLTQFQFMECQEFFQVTNGYKNLNEKNRQKIVFTLTSFILVKIGQNVSYHWILINKKSVDTTIFGQSNQILERVTHLKKVI